MKKILNKIIDLFKVWPELWSFPIGIAMFFLSIPVLRWLDPTSATFDAGVIQVIIVTAVIISSLSTITFLGIKFNFRIMWDYYIKKKLLFDWLNLTPIQRCILFLSFYFGMLYLTVTLAIALI